MKNHKIRTNDKGFTLIELIVVLAVFIVIIIIATNTFEIIIKQNVKLATSEESNIEGIVGLEIFRHDLEQAGFGLPTSYSTPSPSYSEAMATPAQNYNDAPTGIPRPVIAGNNLNSGNVLPNTDYLVLKGTSLGLSQTSQRWTYVNYSSSGKSPKSWPSGNLSVGDNAIVLRRVFSTSGTVTNQLVCSSSANFYVNFTNATLPAGFQPGPQDMFNIYGVDTNPLRMPFNRADYFISASQNTLPKRCAANTGILYKAVVNQTDGNLTYLPLLDCVADMQVVFGWDLTGSGLISAYSNADGSTVNGGVVSQVQSLLANQAGIQNSLKLIKIYILAQDGVKDPTFTNSSNTILVGSEENGEASITKNYDLNANQLMHYHWKVYRIVVQPKNIVMQ